MSLYKNSRPGGSGWAALAVAAILSARAFAAGVYQFDIPAQDLGEALRVFGQAAGQQLVFEEDAVKGRVSAALNGELSAQQALEKLLQGTELTVRRGTSGVWVIEKKGAVPVAAAEGRNESGKEILLGQADTSPASSGQSLGEQQRASSVAEADDKLEEIVVTAQKREERLQDVPVPVTAVNGEILANSNQLQLQSYYTRVPGLNLALSGDTDTPLISIRGITTGGLTNPTVGVVIDEVSYGGTVLIAAPQSPPDIDPSDLARVEVLRGPQGSLYGASSMGGLLKYVTIDPSTAGFSGRLQAGLSSIQNGEVGSTLRGAFNVPLSDALAVRASGFMTREPGYVDNTLTGQKDVNRRDSDGGRVSALWKPSADVSLKLSALIQDSKRRGPSDADVALGSDFKESVIRGTGTYDRKTRAYSATLNAKLGQFDLVSASGYSIDKIFQDVDVTAILGAPTLLLEGRRIEKFTQEFRASVPIGQRAHWLMGAFYTHEDGIGAPGGSFFSTDPNVGKPVSVSLYTNDSPNKFEEYAAFTNLTFDLTDRLDVQFGGRYSENRQTLSAIRTGIFSFFIFGSDPSIVPPLHAKDHAFTYLVTPRFRVTPDMMVYARVASGYRPGGLNIGCGAPSVECTFGPDKTRNYELGIKGDFLEHALSVDASLYYIDWKDIQITLTEGVFTPNANGSRAKSRGLEVSVETKPLAGLTLSAWAAYNDAKLTKDFPVSSSAFGASGDRLPYGSRFSGNVSIDQEFALTAAARGFVTASAAFVGDRKGTFQATPARATFPSYSQVDFNMGVRYDTWTLNAFVNNATDKRGVLRGGADAPFGQTTLFTFIQPRTVGMSVTKLF